MQANLVTPIENQQIATTEAETQFQMNGILITGSVNNVHGMVLAGSHHFAQGMKTDDGILSLFIKDIVLFTGQNGGEGVQAIFHQLFQPWLGMWEPIPELLR